MAGGLYVPPLVRTLATRNVFTASTVDQMPKHVSCGYLFGHPLAIPVPDVDRTDFLLILGANPWESNGSLATAADMPGRLRAIQARGGRFVVVDPRRTRTAEHADEHLIIRPGTDAFLLFGIVHTLFDEGLADLGALGGHVTGADSVRDLARAFPPELVSAACAVPAARIRGLARELAAAPRAVVYGRIGTCTVEFGTLTSWLVDVVNVLTGNLDRPGGAMFPQAAHLRPRTRTGSGPGSRPSGKGFRTGRWHSRVRGLPEVRGELPVAALADEIVTPGDERVRALVTVAGNPVLSTPNSDRLDEALGELDFMASVDPYLNETTRHADVVLPPDDPSRKGHYDFSFLALAVRNFAAYSPPVLPPHPDGMDECDILARLVLIAAGQGATTEPSVLHERLLTDALERAAAQTGEDADTLRKQVTGDHPAERLLDVALRTGAYAGLSLDRLLDSPHGVDLGPLRPRIPEILQTPSGTVELCPAPIAADVERLRQSLDRPRDGLVLIGRRHLRSNNSWMHNVPALVKGRDRCTLQVHPDDAARLRLADGAACRVTSRVGTLSAPVEITDRVMPGVVSLPHGWGHDRADARLTVAAAHPGVNSNVLTDDLAIDPLSGNAVLNGIPVEVTVE
jgi:anaerobic selenocysteine-containing dehydrogenase